MSDRRKDCPFLTHQPSPAHESPICEPTPDRKKIFFDIKAKLYRCRVCSAHFYEGTTQCQK